MENPTEDDDTPQLSAATFAALKEFYAERNTQAQLLEQANTKASTTSPEQPPPTGPLSMSAFTEDWNASQFWYTDATANTLARSLLTHSAKRIAIVSAPSVFAALKKELHDQHNAHANPPKVDESDTAASAAVSTPSSPALTLLEFDKRFAVWPEFEPYDYTTPTQLPVTLRGAFDTILVDPPFLSDECQTKAALTVRWLAEAWRSTAGELRVVVCTGERMGSLVRRLYGGIGVRETDFVVRHASGLSNEFRCFANFEWEGWRFREGVE